MTGRASATRRNALRLIAAGSITGAFPSLVAAQARQELDLNLALAVDASGSVNQARFELQKRGYVEAFENPEVLKAIRSGQRGAIAVTMYQWTGPRQQIQIVPWTMLEDRRSILDLAGRISGAPRQLFGGGTSISGAIDYGVQVLSNSPFVSARYVIDVSGDGANNGGRLVDQARDEAVDRGVNINGLPILAVEPGLEEHYRRNVIGGPGAFLVPASSFEDFGNAILKKLIMEISAAPDGGRSSSRGAPA